MERIRTVTKSDAVDELCINTIRTLSIDAIEKANSGHPGAPMALAPISHRLFSSRMRHNPANPRWFDRDRFVLSNGHASMLLYATLHVGGYDLSLDDIKAFRELGSPTAGHPEFEAAASSGVEVTTGPLGQGFAHSVGFALAERMLAARFNVGGHEPIDHRTFVIASDGDLQEGVASEAASLAGHLGLGRLCVIYDANDIQLAGPTSMSFSEDTAMRFRSYGWHVGDIGEDLSAGSLDSALDEAAAETERPSLIIARTHIGFGAPNKQDSATAHGSPLGAHETRLAKQAYGWDPDAHFLVPGEVDEHRRAARERGEQAEAEWGERLDAYRAEHPEHAAELERIIAGRLPEGWRLEPPRFDPKDGKVATRKASQRAIQWAAGAIPELVSGSADLEPSTNTEIDGGGSVAAGSYDGRNVHYGVREHAMAAAVNGLRLHGLRAFGSTFFNFIDYQKPSLRLAALMGVPSIAVFTHDSIGLGEDGPTHQPVEQLAMLRAMPHTEAIRPADANETALAWEYALAREGGPTALVLTRQGLPVIDPALIPSDAIERGAYVLLEEAADEPDAILIATGSEVSLCLEAAELLEAAGLATRVVSMPCAERFLAQDRDYRDDVLPPGCRARVSVEAGSTLGWERFVTEDGASIGMDEFGASAPAAVLFEHFGFTPEKVAERARAVADRLAGVAAE
ncbi:transketolase [Thermoleophilia bacterium SCSIO 60948]|nr:transketolase [Thermoleophilia bacterium SCSIO 60948]